MGAMCSCSSSCSAMGPAEASKFICKSESLWPRFKRRINQKGKNQSSMTAPFLNYPLDISPTCSLISEKSKALVRIVSISRDREFVPVIISSVGKSIPNEPQPTKKKKQMRFDAAEIKAKSRVAKIAVNSRELEVCIEEEGEATVKKSDHRSWVRVAKTFQFLKTPARYRNEPEVSQEQPKTREIQQKKEVRDSIPGPIEHMIKSSRTSAAVDCKSSKLWKFINFHRKANSHGSKCQGIKSTTLSQIPRPGMKSITPNFQSKKINISAGKKGTITGDTRSEGEGYSVAINLSILIVIMACLVVLSNRVLAVVCTTIWWYLLPTLLEKNRLCPFHFPYFSRYKLVVWNRVSVLRVL